ncbi:putative membrane protein [Streptacidiphilus sp. MAP12-20]
MSAGTDEIRHFGADSVQVLRRLRTLYERLAWLCDARQRDALRVRLEAMDRHAAQHWTQALDRALVQRPDAQGLGSELGTDLS